MTSIASPVRRARASGRRSGLDALRTERSIALIRLAVIAVVTVIYLGSLDERQTHGPTALAVLLLATVYSIWGLAAFAGPGEPSMRARVLTLLADLALITMWVQATGGPKSDYWTLFVIALIAVAMRFDLLQTLAVAAGVAVLYLAVMHVDGELSGVQALHRTSVMLLTGFAAGVLSRQRIVQRRERQALQELVDERSVELDLERAEVERLRRVDVAKSEFVAVAAHEFRTPLAAVIGVLSTLKEHGDVLTPDERDELLEGASKQAARLARLVDDQLTVSRIEDGALRLNLEAVDPRLLLSEAAQSSEMTGRLVIQLGRVDRVRCDRDAVIRVLTNLLDNARKYSPPDSKVHITVEQAGDLVRFRVRDEGPGIPEAERDHVFERFRRVEGAAAKPGTGLGLYICRALVEAHGGVIGVEPAAEGGTVFSFTLPRATKADVDVSVASTDGPSGGASTLVPEAEAEVPSAAVT